MGISAVLIVKNEEAKLARCIRSLEGVDQVVVHDTGSTDGTVELAKSLGAEVSVGEPIRPFHFAEARNRALAYADQDWVFSMDADEALRTDSLDAIRKAFLEHPEADGFNTSFVMLAPDGSENARIMKLKVFRRGRWAWRYRIHELLYPTAGEGRTADVPEAVVEHLPLIGKEGRRGQNLELLRLSVEENPEYLRNFRQLALELFLREDFEGAIPHMERFISGAKGHDFVERSEDLSYVARCHAGVGRLDMALEWFDRAAAAAPFRREPLWYAALALIKAARLEEAVAYIERLLKIPRHQKPGSHLDQDPIWESSLPWEAVEFCRKQIAEAKAKLRERGGG